MSTLVIIFGFYLLLDNIFPDLVFLFCSGTFDISGATPVIVETNGHTTVKCITIVP